MKRMNRFDRWFWKRLLSLVKPYWFRDERRQGNHSAGSQRWY